MRSKEFNSNSVLEKCIQLFWNTSYGGCSVKDIVEKTNVNRFSLYEEFEHKEGILLASIDLYRERYSNPKFDLLNKEDELFKVLFNFFMSFMHDTEKYPSGCYIIRLATELADNNSEVKLKLNEYLNALEHQFTLVLQKHPETKNSAHFFAKHLVGLFCSLTTFCVIHSFIERESLVTSGISLLLKKQSNHATYTS